MLKVNRYISTSSNYNNKDNNNSNDNEKFT